MDSPTFKLQVANGELEAPTKTVQLQFEIGDWTFKETFLVATEITAPILELTFLKNNSAILDVSQALLHFPHLTYAISAWQPDSVKKPQSHHPKPVNNHARSVRHSWGRHQFTHPHTHTTGIIHSTEQYSGDNQVVVASSLSIASNSKIEVRVPNTSPNQFTLKKMQQLQNSPSCHHKELNKYKHSIQQPSRS